MQDPPNERTESLSGEPTAMRQKVLHLGAFMARKHPDAISYWNDVGPRLFDFIQKKRNPDVEQCVSHALALYSYVIEDFSAQVTKHKDVHPKTSILLVLVQDVLRGLYGAQCELSPVAAAGLFRTALEVRCSQLFIIKSDDPAKWADRFHRYSEVEKVLHEQHRPKGGLSMLPPAERERILKSCPEWFNEKGEVKVPHWTADKKLKSLKAMAQVVGLEDDYHSMYGIGSKFMHGSPLLVNLYSRGGNLGVVANPALCTQLALLGTNTCIDMLQEAADFFGILSFENDLLHWKHRWIACFEQVSRGG